MWNLKLTIRTPERSQWRRFAVFIINFRQISGVSIENFERVNASYAKTRQIFLLYSASRFSKQILRYGGGGFAKRVKFFFAKINGMLSQEQHFANLFRRIYETTIS